MSAKVAIAIMGLFLAACSQHDAESQPAFTLSTGVSLLEVQECETSHDATAGLLSVEKQGGDYIVRVRAYSLCDAKRMEPFLISGSDHGATLVLTAMHSDGVFKSGCECLQTMKIKISGRLDPGTTLYVLNHYDVLGHYVLP